MSDLKRMGDAPDLDFTVGDYGVQRIGGENYEHGVSMLVYPEDPDDGSGVPDLRIETDGRYARMSGYVGIDDDASDDCAGASVSITDGNDEQLWPPEGGELKVYGDDADPERFSFRMDRPEQVKLVQRSLAESEDDGCGGSANPAWGKFLFFP